MPHDHDLNEFMKSIEDLAYRLANPADAVDYDQREARIKYALKEAYLAGYAQCKQDYHNHTGEIVSEHLKIRSYN
jgi:hypothetical protein